MSETKSEVKTYKIDMKCDNCGEGYMRPIGNIVILATYPIQYPHKCTKCGYSANYTTTYPYEIFEEK